MSRAKTWREHIKEGNIPNLKVAFPDRPVERITVSKDGRIVREWPGPYGYWCGTFLKFASVGQPPRWKRIALPTSERYAVETWMLFLPRELREGFFREWIELRDELLAAGQSRAFVGLILVSQLGLMLVIGAKDRILAWGIALLSLLR